MVASANRVSELQHEISKLEESLAEKCDQVKTLRLILTTNKNTAETALNSLKRKHEQEKLVINQTVSMLRHDLRILKEDEVRFPGLRERCDEYMNEVDDLMRQLDTANEEKKTLSQLLRLALLQKIDLAKRLEEIEGTNYVNRMQVKQKHHVSLN